ncbi:MAG: response regulator [Nitrospinota bacterium]|nr:response regulator [Nitrospinota bacterium]
MGLIKLSAFALSFCFAFFGAALGAHGAVLALPAQISENVGPISLAPHMEWMEDRGRELTIEDVTSLPRSSDFRPVGASFYSYFLSESAFWYRLTIRNPSSREQLMVLQNEVSWLDVVEMYEQGPEGGFRMRRAGDSIPFREREFSHPTAVFHISLAPGEERTFHFRVEAMDAFLSPFTLWEDKAFEESDRGRTIYFGTILGIITVMFFFNVILMFFLRERRYLQYNIYLSILGIWFLTYNGFSFQYIWPESPVFQNRMMVFLDYAMQLSAVLFTRAFLDSRNTLPTLDKVLSGVIWLFVVMIVVDIITPFHYFTGFVCLVFLQLYGPLLAVSGLVALRAGIRSARFFLLAWISTTIGVSLTALIVVGVLPYSFWLFRAGEIGVMMDIVLLALALADRINILRLEKEEAQLTSRKVLEKAREELTVKVEERTLELREALRRAEEATKLKDKFVSLVSHDLRSPLASMKGLVEAIDLDDDSPTVAEKNINYLRRVSLSLGGLLQMTEQLLNLTRIKTGRITPMKKMFNARQRVGALLVLMEPTASQKGIELANNLPEDMTLLADLDLYQEVIRNLVSNSIKFCRSGDMVTVHSPPGYQNTVAVRDTGPGIDKETLSRLFTHGEKTTKVGSAGEKGTGLGLEFSHEIMLAHGGDLTVSPLEGGGVEFYVTLPASRAIILLVDDQKVHRKMMLDAMGSELSVDVLEADDGIEALEIMKLARPDLVVVDVFMPGINGLELLKIMKNTPALSSIPVIIAATVSHYDGQADAMRAQALQMGAVDLVEKPLEAEEFLEAILKILA